METPILFTALREFTTGLLNQLLVNLSGQDGSTWYEELKKFLRKEPCWVVTLESFFKKTIQIVLEPTERKFSVKEDISKFLPLKEDGGKLDYLDPDIIGWFGNVTIKGRASKIVSCLYRFLINLTHQEIISTGEKFKIYHKYNIFDAIEFAGKLINAGEVEKPGTGVIIYLKEKYDNRGCRLGVGRGVGGGLCVFVSGVGPGVGWGAGCGVLFS